ncbi:hypothetical protein Zm00014a_006774 [Zea mays]|uniref:Uncharacterized protein n=1 Tax=Zea mays TaxID=4577 RepID=A0A3L6G1Q9_MAIZE|nr:hypothetical protein Zm00014a_006774 [Zea mays]
MCTLSHDELAEVQVMVRPRSQLALPSDPMALASRRFFRQRTWRVPGCISKAMPLPPTSCQRLRRACHLNRRCRPRAMAAMSNGTAPAIQKSNSRGRRRRPPSHPLSLLSRRPCRLLVIAGWLAGA